MGIAGAKKLSDYRLLLGNPYAGIEQIEELDSIRGDGLSAVIRASRKNLQDPYAFLDGDGAFVALAKRSPRQPPKASFEEIEKLVIKLQRRLWGERANLFDMEVDRISPIDVLSPEKAAELLGYRMEVVDSLGTYADRIERIEVAGLIDRSGRRITISSAFTPAAQKFTSAHEIGHLVLHPHLEMVHRDRTVDGVLGGRIRTELEADKFAAYFLMPAKLLGVEFSSRFLTGVFELNETTCYALFGHSMAGFDGKVPAGRKLARKLAAATSYNGKNFYSLAAYFGVTVEAMAIRLEELGLL